MAAPAAYAQITASPAAVSAAPASRTTVVGLTVAHNPTQAPQPVTVNFTGLPAGVSTIPVPPDTATGPVAFTALPGKTVDTVSFRFSTISTTPPGTYAVSMTATGVTCGFQGTQCSGALTLTVLQPSFTIEASPNPVRLQSGAAPQTVVVATKPDPGFAQTITYAFSGLPAGITWGTPQTTASPYPALLFPFSAATGTAPGTYAGLLTGTAPGIAPKRIVFAVVVEAPSITATLTRPSLSLCAGGPPVDNALILQPVNGYTGTPTVEVVRSSDGFAINPATLTVPPLPPARTIPFTVTAAAAAPPAATLGLRVRDGAAGVDTTATMVLSVVAPDFTAAVAPPSALVAAGSTVTAYRPSLAGNMCFAASSVAVTPSGAPSGVTFSPATMTLSPPSWASSGFAVTVDPSVAPGTYPVQFTFTSSDGATRTAAASLTVTVGPDFALAVAPTALEIAAGGSGSVAVSATGRNGFTGQVAVSAPSIAGVTFTPSSFVLATGQSATVAVAVARSTPPQTSTALFRATAADIIGDRTAMLALTVAPAPDYSLSVSPAAVTVEAGASTAATVSATGMNGFSDTITVSAMGTDLAVTPPVFTLLPGASRTVSITAPASTSAGPRVVRLAGTVAGMDPRYSMLTVAVTPASPTVDSVTPPALAAGSYEMLLRLVGTNFRSGATVRSSSPDVVVRRTTVLSATAVDALVDVGPDATPGPYRLDLVNTDGTRTAAGAIVLVYPQSSLAAPLGVTAAAIVHPRPYALLDPEQPLFPRGLLATTGVGTIVGSWTLDGFPFARFVVQTAGGMPVQITSDQPVPATSIGEHRLELVVEQPRSLASAPVPVVQSTGSSSRLTVYEPEDGAVIRAGDAVFRWSVVPGASGYRLEVETPPDEPAFSVRLSGTEWRPSAEDLRAIGGGPHRFRVRAVFPGNVPGAPTPWREIIVSDGDDSSPRTGAAAPGEPSPAALRGPATGTRPGDEALVPAVLQEETPVDAQPAPDVARDGTASLMVAATATDANDGYASDAARAELSANLDLAVGAFRAKGAGDLSGRRDLDAPHDTATESRNWDLLFGVGSEAFRVEARGGYSPPGFLDQSELLTPGLARGGIEARVVTSAGSLGYYRSTRSMPAALGMSYGAPQRVEAVGIEAPGDPSRFLLRVFALRTETDAAPEFGTPGGKSEAVGVLGRFSIGPTLAIVFEGATGSMTPTVGEKIDGSAFRLGLSGSAGRVMWSVGVRKTESDFVNPVNPGFTPGGVPDRVGADLSLSTSIGSAMISIQARRLESGGNDGTPTITEDGGALNLSLPLGGGVMASATANVTTTTGDADPTTGLPATDRTQRGASLTVSESVGAASFSQSLSWQDMSDETFAGLDQRIVSAGLNAFGTLGPTVSLSGMVSATRSDGAPEVGRTDQVMLSLQPAVTLSPVHLTVTPRASYSRSENDRAGGVNESEQYQLLLDWTPPWLASSLAFQLSGDLMRSTSSLQETTPPFTRRIVFAITMRGGASLAPPPPAADTVAHGPRPYLPQAAGLL